MIEPGSELSPVKTPADAAPPMPWSVRETWLGLLLMVGVIGGMVVLSAMLPEEGLWRPFLLVLLEPMLLLPVAIVLGRRRISWKHLGFRRFSGDGMAIGCGLMTLVYPLVILHNFILVGLGIETQGDSLTSLYDELGAPAAFLAAGILLAPIVEEIFFRGFLFPGLRQRFGWVKAMLISSAIFASFHLQLVAFIPTFLLGCVLAFVWQRTDSIWPGVILHFTINAAALCAAAAMIQFGWV